MKGDDVDDRIHVKTIKSTLGTHSIIQEIMCTVHWMQTFLLDKKKEELSAWHWLWNML